MKKLLATLFAVFLFSGISAAIIPAECPDDITDFETQFWHSINHRYSSSIDEVVTVRCAVASPAITFEEFKSLSFINKTLKKYPDTIVDWLIKDDTMYQVRGSLQNTQIEFVKIGYCTTTGNIIISRVLYTVKTDSLKDNIEVEYDH